MIGQWRRLGVVFPLGGFVLGARHRQARPVDGRGCGDQVSVDGGSNVGNAAMVEVFGSSLVCPRVCLGLFVVVKSKLLRRALWYTMTGCRRTIRRSSAAPAVPGFVLRSSPSESELSCLVAGG